MPHEIPFSKIELEGEKWKPIIEFPGYDISNLGRARSWLTIGKKLRTVPLILKQHIVSSDKRLRITPRKDKKTFHKSIHILVLETFIGKRPKGLLGCHSDDNCWNNRLWNLKWATSKTNYADQEQNNKILKGEQHGMSRLTETQIIDIRNRYANGEKASKLAKEFGVLRTHITDIKSGRVWKHVGGIIHNPKTTTGENNGLAKLTETQVREIRERSKKGQSAKSISKLFNVHSHTIRSVIVGRTWKHIV